MWCGVNYSDVEALAADREALRHLTRRLGALAETDLSELSPAESADHVTEMVNVHEQLARLTGAAVRVAERSMTHVANGQKSMTALIRARTHLHTTQASRYKTAADAVDQFPTFAKAFAEEQLTLGHLDVMTRLLARANSAQVMDCEPALCALAVLCTTEEFRDKAKEWEAAADPTEHLDDYIKAQADEHFWYGKDLFGNLHFSGTFSPLNGEEFLQALDRRSESLWRQDQEEAKHLPGCPMRTATQRRAAALLELVVDGSSTPAGSKRPEPLIEIITTNPDCTCGSTEAVPARASGMPTPTNIYPQTLDRKLIPYQIIAALVAEGNVRTALVNNDGNPLHDPVLDGRDFTDRQKRQIRLRDRKCQHHGCTSPARYCEYDHIQPHAKHGPTKVTNGQLLCKFHHRWKHKDDPRPNTIQRE